MGRAILELDYLWLFAAIVLLIAVYAPIVLFRHRRAPPAQSTPTTPRHLAFGFGVVVISGGVIAVYTGLKLIAVLILTRPPAYNLLDDLDRLLIGATGGLILLFFPLFELYRFLSGDDHRTP